MTDERVRFTDLGPPHTRNFMQQPITRQEASNLIEHISKRIDQEAIVWRANVDELICAIKTLESRIGTPITPPTPPAVTLDSAGDNGAIAGCNVLPLHVRLRAVVRILAQGRIAAEELGMRATTKDESVRYEARCSIYDEVIRDLTLILRAAPE